MDLLVSPWRVESLSGCAGGIERIMLTEKITVGVFVCSVGDVGQATERCIGSSVGERFCHKPLTEAFW